MSGRPVYGIAVLLLIETAALSSCGSGAASTSAEAAQTTASNEAAPAGDLDSTEADTSGSKGGETYADFDARRDAEPSPGSVGGYGCTEDCSGHDAGYQWASEHGVTDESECGGNSWSFEEGCAAYAKEQEVGSEDDQDDGEQSE